jgi:type VI secretion system protein ImpA
MVAYADLFATLKTSSSCGENLEYSPEFLALQQAVAGRPEQQFGSTIIPEQAPDWALIEREATQLCERTCDIRIVVVLTQALAELKGLTGFADGVELLAAILEQHWDDVYPLLHLDDEYDPMPRINALISLGDLQGAVRSARSASLLEGVHGQVSVRDAEALLDGSRTQSESYPGGRPRLVEALRHAHAMRAPELMAISRSLLGLAAIETAVASRIGAEWTPDFSGIRRTLSVIANVIETAAPTGPVVEQDQAPNDGNPLPNEAALAEPADLVSDALDVAWKDVSIRSRGDALLALEQVCSYFERYEPSHPAPFLIRRAQQTIPLDFHEMLRNLAPQGLDQFEAWIPKSPAQ